MVHDIVIEVLVKGDELIVRFGKYWKPYKHGKVWWKFNLTKCFDLGLSL